MPIDNCNARNIRSRMFAHHIPQLHRFSGSDFVAYSLSFPTVIELLEFNIRILWKVESFIKHIPKLSCLDLYYFNKVIEIPEQ